MSARARSPSEQPAGEAGAQAAVEASSGIELIGASRVRSNIVTPVGISMYAPVGLPGRAESFEGDATDVNPRQGPGAAEQPTPTAVDPHAPLPPSRPGPARHALSTAGVTGPAAALRPGVAEVPGRGDPAGDASEPVQVISMMDRVGKPRRPAAPRVPLHVQLRSLGEAARSQDTPARGLGYLAPPRDHDRMPERRLGGIVVRVCAAVGLAAVIAVAIWLVAGR